MLDKQSNQSILPAHNEHADMPTKNMKITHDVVMALSDRIYGMLLRELRVERERQRFLNRSHRR